MELMREEVVLMREEVVPRAEVVPRVEVVPTVTVVRCVATLCRSSIRRPSGVGVMFQVRVGVLGVVVDHPTMTEFVKQ